MLSKKCEIDGCHNPVEPALPEDYQDIIYCTAHRQAIEKEKTLYEQLQVLQQENKQLRQSREKWKNQAVASHTDLRSMVELASVLFVLGSKLQPIGEQLMQLEPKYQLKELTGSSMQVMKWGAKNLTRLTTMVEEVKQIVQSAAPVLQEIQDTDTLRNVAGGLRVLHSHIATQRSDKERDWFEKFISKLDSPTDKQLPA